MYSKRYSKSRGGPERGPTCKGPRARGVMSVDGLLRPRMLVVASADDS
jgi:hypothetical protein